MDNIRDNPKFVSVHLDELVDIVYSAATDDCLSRAKRHAKGYLDTIQMNKKYRLVYSKRVVDHNSFKTFPYGYM